ncbi:MAG: response regulator [Crocinitomix sp.]|nr:response regulator [Crocinitomix sp.]
MINCLVIDDDPLICDLIKHFCSKLSWIGSCWSVEDGNQGLQAISSQKFDLIFLDYNLPDLSGKELLNLIPKEISVIMVTTEENFGAASYEYQQIVDFLVKPISYERFLKALLKFQQQNAAPLIHSLTAQDVPNKLMVKDGNTSVIITIDSIQYIKSESNYVLFFLTNKKVMSLMSLKQLEQDLPNNFFRIHKSYIINLNYLDTISTDEITVAGIPIPIGPKHKEGLLAKLTEMGLR